MIKKVESRSANDLNINPIIRKAPWTHNRIQTNQANPLLPDSKAADNKIATGRNVSVSGASRKNKVAVNRAAVSRVAAGKAVASRAAVNKEAADRAAANKADDKTGSFEQQSGGNNSRRFVIRTSPSVPYHSL